ncbi:MAG TPA: hypothetical protein VF188_00070 [Longimicrobiales bacterium]
MRQILSVLALSLGTAGFVSAQTVQIQPGVGVFAPLMPLVEVDDGFHADVELDAAPAVGLAVDVVVHPLASVYGGINAAFTRMNHGDALELRDVDSPASSRVNVLFPSAGVLVTPRIGASPIQPRIRLGGGVKVYDFDLFDVKEMVVEPAADLGLGVIAGEGPVSFTAEARWALSRFDPRTLPIRLIAAEDQTQNDWLFQLGFAVRP